MPFVRLCSVTEIVLGHSSPCKMNTSFPLFLFSRCFEYLSLKYLKFGEFSEFIWNIKGVKFIMGNFNRWHQK